VERWSYSSALANFIGDTTEVRDYSILIVIAGGEDIIATLGPFADMAAAYETAKKITMRHNAALSALPLDGGDVK
jgi:hypothetical protein